MIIFDGLAPRVLVFTTPFKGLILNFRPRVGEEAPQYFTKKTAFRKGEAVFLWLKFGQKIRQP